MRRDKHALQRQCEIQSTRAAIIEALLVKMVEDAGSSLLVDGQQEDSPEQYALYELGERLARSGHAPKIIQLLSEAIEFKTVDCSEAA